MPDTHVAIEISEEQIQLLDEIAENLGSDREGVIREALAEYLADHKLVEEETRVAVEEAIRQADAGELVDHAEVARWFELQQQRSREAA